MKASVPRSRASLWQPQGEGCSGRHFAAPRTVEVIQSHRTCAKREGRLLHCTVRAEYSRYQSDRRREGNVDQRRRPDTEFDYNFAPPPSSSRGSPPPPNGGPPRGPHDDGNNKNLKNYLIAAAFFIGMGSGVWFSSTANFTPSNVASTQIVDSKTPNSEICMASGYSSMVFDQRIFVSFNPFNVYVAQPEVKPGCVLRQSNVNVLEKRKLVSPKEVAGCTRSSNTFAFVGDLERSPEVSCVYHSEDAENEYLKNPKRAVLGDGFRSTDKDSTTVVPPPSIAKD